MSLPTVDSSNRALEGYAKSTLAGIDPATVATGLAVAGPPSAQLAGTGQNFTSFEQALLTELRTMNALLLAMYTGAGQNFNLQNS